MKEQLEAEKAAFNSKIETKLSHGFVPDLQALQQNDYFVKQFWRSPYIARAVMGKLVDTYMGFIIKYGPKRAEPLKVLDVGCGSGCVTLELARRGLRVKGVDIADRAIEAASKAADKASKTDEFGELSYEALALEDVQGTFDVILFSASLHHMPDIEAALLNASNLLDSGGILVCHEPSPEMWKREDASQLALVRVLLSATGNWYDKSLAESGRHPDGFATVVDSVLDEMCENRDEFEPDGQSEHDDMNSGKKIQRTVRDLLDVLHEEPGNAFRHSGMGGIRGSEDVIQNLTDILMMYEQYALDGGLMKANGHLMVARKRSGKSMNS